MAMLYCKVKRWGWGPALVISLLLLVMGGCSQDAIFDDISREVPPTNPLIEGAPSKIVKAGNTLYVANGRIWYYALNGDGRWHSFNGPGGYVVDVAATSGGALYALTISNTSTGVWKNAVPVPGTDADWAPIATDAIEGGYSFIQNIYAAGDQLFAGGAKSAGDAYNYAILYEDPPNGFKELVETGRAVLSGAGVLGNVYYLATRGSGIYTVTGAPSPGSAAPVTTSPVVTNIAGFLQTRTSSGEDCIIAAGRNGYILCNSGTAGSFTGSTTSLGGTFTGALALTKAYNYEANPPEPVAGVDLLLIGVQGGNTSYNHGYREVEFDTGAGKVTGSTATVPGEGDQTSIAKNGNYGSTLRRYPVTSIFALEHISETNPDPIMFASTASSGFYSYRNRSDGGWQWNHEE